jgi:hypothetical protein
MHNNADDYGNVYFSKDFVGEPYSDYIFKVNFTVLFKNKEKNISKQIIDRDGNIIDFPGVEYTDKLKEELESWNIAPVVKYKAKFEKIDEGKFIMVWTVRPDGRYWMDSWGFGAEDYESLSLYTYIDSDGNFMMPFKLYSIGYQRFDKHHLTEDSK